MYEPLQLHPIVVLTSTVLGDPLEVCELCVSDHTADHTLLFYPVANVALLITSNALSFSKACSNHLLCSVHTMAPHPLPGPSASTCPINTVIKFMMESTEIYHTRLLIVLTKIHTVRVWVGRRVWVETYGGHLGAAAYMGG